MHWVWRMGGLGDEAVWAAREQAAVHVGQEAHVMQAVIRLQSSQLQECMALWSNLLRSLGSKRDGQTVQRCNACNAGPMRRMSA